mmetsp:Transcript_45555/g.117731  ORF Transcript_45555/g.117731 Transcript_45555/m.117731 type:complete len:264 (-) Transcript_45555:659-1450(-)
MLKYSPFFFLAFFVLIRQPVLHSFSPSYPFSLIQHHQADALHFIFPPCFQRYCHCLQQLQPRSLRVARLFLSLRAPVLSRPSSLAHATTPSSSPYHTSTELIPHCASHPHRAQKRRHTCTHPLLPLSGLCYPAVQPSCTSAWPQTRCASRLSPSRTSCQVIPSPCQGLHRRGAGRSPLPSLCRRPPLPPFRGKKRARMQPFYPLPSQLRPATLHFPHHLSPLHAYLACTSCQACSKTGYHRAGPPLSASTSPAHCWAPRPCLA